MNPRTVAYRKLTKRIRESMRRDFYRLMPQDAGAKSPAEQFDESHKRWLQNGRGE